MKMRKTAREKSFLLVLNKLSFVKNFYKKIKPKSTRPLGFRF